MLPAGGQRVTTPSEREYLVYRRGEVRELILRTFREGLRALVDPETGEPVSEDTIRLVTAKGGRWWTEAEGDDLVVMGAQKSNEFLAQQLRIDRAGGEYLDRYHGVLWGAPRLPAFGGSGRVTARGLPGMTWPGSTTIPNVSFATYGLDPSNKRYQVLVTAVADAEGVAELTVAGIDGGSDTNLEPGTEIRWVNPPPGSDPDAVTAGEKFRGGADAETDAAYAERLIALVRHKAASGNWAHIRSYARQVSVSVEDAFVYSCAFRSGSELVAITQKRGDAVGPGARLPSEGVLAAVTLALVPPSSALVPGRVHVLVTPPVLQPSNAAMLLALPFGSPAGWTDLEPFPPINGTAAVAITTVTSQTDIRITTSAPGLLPGGASSATGLHLMVWDVPTSAFITLAVTTITDLGAGVYRVQLASAPDGHTLALGDWVSPDMARRADLAAAVTAYFDSLGPGEVVPALDERYSRAYRNPVPNEEKPQRAGQSIVSTITEALGAPVGDAQLAAPMTVTTPSVPADPVSGPNLIVAGKFAAYHLA